MLPGMVLALLTGCGPVALLNSPPSVQLESPDPGQLVSHRDPVVFVATVDDDYTPIDELTYLWVLADGTPIPGETLIDVAENTVTFTTAAPLPKGEPTVTLRVIDGFGESSRATVKLLVFDDVAPSITWNHPVDGGEYAGGEPLEVSVTITDPDPLADTLLTLKWTGAILTGESGVPTSLPASGDATFTIDSASLATWTLDLQVVDPLGATTESAVTFRVRDGDTDKDGHLDEALGGDDCDDNASTVHPDATERCNGVDDDCDGVADDAAVDAPLWYLDQDGDDFGDGATAYASCTQPAGRVADTTDCDDTNSAVNPDAIEVCNGVDDDCDLSVDTDAVDATFVWADGDGDGYGAGAGYATCFPAADEVENGDDCDDLVDTVNPAATEVCDPFATDEDCSGAADDADPAVTGQSTFYADLDGDLRGDPALSALRCAAGAGWAANADDCDDAAASAWTGKPETCEDGVDNDCLDGDATCRLAGGVDLSAADYVLTGDNLTFAGGAITSLGDLDGDGLNDLAVGAWAGDDVYVVHAAGLASGALSAFGAYSGTSHDYFGWSLAGVGDVDGDGAPDLLVGAVDAASGAGAAYLFQVDAAGGTEADALWSVSGSSGEKLGAGVAGSADLDGDGDPDVLLGGAGFVRVVDGPTGTLLATWTGAGTGAGGALSVGSDLDGDGLFDAIVGDHTVDEAYVVYGGTPGDLDLTAADVLLTGVSGGDEAGYSVAGLGDSDGDGYGDLLLGAPSATGAATTSGVAYVYSGASVASGSLATAATTWLGEDAADRAGYTVAAPGDVDGDGLADLLIGAYYDESGGVGAGCAYLAYGGPAAGSVSLASADARFIGENAGDAASEGLAGVGDVNADGYADFAVGAPSTGAAAGTAYILLGGGL